MNEKKFEKEILVCYLNVSNLKCGGGEKEFLDGGGRRRSGNLEKMVTVGYRGEGGGGSAVFLWLRSLWTAPKVYQQTKKMFCKLLFNKCFFVYSLGSKFNT